MPNGKVYCITGIDTDIGKTIATGLLARGLVEAGVSVITQKAVQTGCEGVSEDIISHRKIMGCEMLPVDHQGLTCPYLFSTPCSPHLAARIEGKSIDPQRITRATSELRKDFQVILLEGAGGLFVPLREELTLIDYFAEIGCPVILVTSSRLGSINHTLASLEALKARKMELAGVIYNRNAEVDERIAEDSLNMISMHLKRSGFQCPIVEMHHLDYYQKQGSCLPFAAICSH